jgi:hypothetical protein
MKLTVNVARNTCLKFMLKSIPENKFFFFYFKILIKQKLDNSN